MDITFTLQAGFSGTQADNFNISGTTSGSLTLNDISLGSATKAQLATGHTVNADPTITGGTITSTGVCTNSVNWLTFPTPTPTPTEPPADGNCWTFTYDNTLPIDLYVRYTSQETSETVTELINTIQALDNGDDTYTTGICVKAGATYSTPVCVQGGIETTCIGGSWTATIGGTCSSGTVCLIS
jgi:hypothetical protein